MRIDLETLAREHRRAFVWGLGSLVGLWLGMSIADGIEAQARRQAQEAHRLEQEVQDLIARLAGREGAERGLARLLERQLEPKLRAELLLARRPPFVRAEGESPYVAYRRALELVESHREAARRRGVELPADFGLEREPPEERIDEALAHLDALDRLLDRLVERGVRRIEQLALGAPRYVALESEETGGGADAGGRDGVAPRQLVRELPVRVAAHLAPAVAFAVLADLQTAGNAFEIVQLEIGRETDDRLRLQLECAALELVDAAQAPRGRSERGGGDTRGVSRWRRR